MEKAILHKWLKAGYIDKRIFHQTEEGTPQGGPISPVLANLTLDGLEAQLRTLHPSYHQHRRAKINLVRFADDFIITGSSKELLENEVKPLVEAFMKERGLQLSTEKTLITHMADGFDFLGQNVRTYDGKLIIKPSKKNVKTFLEKVRKVVKENQGATAGHLILQLNLLIGGWARYHQHVVSKEIFQDVDSAIFEMLWQWARKRHNNKPGRWIKDKYFHVHEGRNWVFTGMVIGREGAFETVRLFRAAQTPRRENGRHLEGKKAVTCPLETAERTLSSLSSTHYQADRVAQPPQSLAVQRWRRSTREPRVVTSNLSPTTSQPRKLRSGTVS